MLYESIVDIHFFKSGQEKHWLGPGLEWTEEYVKANISAHVLEKKILVTVLEYDFQKSKKILQKNKKHKSFQELQ